MQKHTKVYYDFFGYSECDFVPCEVCGKQAVDIHHIEPRSKFGSKMKGSEAGHQDHINNLIALCRTDHDHAHNGIWIKETLYSVHSDKINLWQKRKD